MTDGNQFELRITNHGLFYCAYGEVKHFVSRRALQEIIQTEEGMLVTLLGAHPDQLEIKCDPFTSLEFMYDFMTKGWPIDTNDNWRAYRWTFDNQTIPL